MERTLDELRASIPAPARDMALNLQNVLAPGGALDTNQRYEVALACALTTQHPELIAAMRAEASAAVPEGVIEDARAAAALMAMNNVYYRFRHMVGKSSYEQRPARLRMTRMAKLSSSKADFELTCLAVSAINGCEACVRSHEAAVLSQGLTEEHVHDAVRIAATIRGVAVALGV